MKSKPAGESPTNLSEIYSFRAVGDRLGTAGQPTQTQFQMIRESGFEAVINLALPTSDNAIPNEGSLVTSLGMSYIHIPVDFKAPTDQDLQTFCRVMEAFGDRRVFVHCAANMRVSAFVFLYRVLCQHVGVQEAEGDLHAIWQPDDVWTRFIQDRLQCSA
ncbi:MAG: protein tyrosine phosphatase family protein [Limisphaerales bacterium]